MLGSVFLYYVSTSTELKAVRLSSGNSNVDNDEKGMATRKNDGDKNR